MSLIAFIKEKYTYYTVGQDGSIEAEKCLYFIIDDNQLSILL